MMYNKTLLKKPVMVEWSKLDPEQFFKTLFLQKLFPKLLEEEILLNIESYK